MVAFFGNTFDRPMYIIDTDYETYTLVYGCRVELIKGKREDAWIMTRDAIVDLQKKPDESYFIKKFEESIPTFNYQEAFGNKYGIQGAMNGCDGSSGQGGAFQKENEGWTTGAYQKTPALYILPALLAGMYLY